MVQEKSEETNPTGQPLSLDTALIRTPSGPAELQTAGDKEQGNEAPVVTSPGRCLGQDLEGGSFSVFLRNIFG